MGRQWVGIELEHIERVVSNGAVRDLGALQAWVALARWGYDPRSGSSSLADTELQRRAGVNRDEMDRRIRVLRQLDMVRENGPVLSDGSRYRSLAYPAWHDP